MRRLWTAGLILLICVSIFAACAPQAATQPEEEPAQTAQPTEQPTPEPTEQPTPRPTEAPTEMPAEEPAEEAEEAAAEEDRSEEVLAFLAALGLGADTQYENEDWFETDLLVSVPGVSKAQFEAVDQKLKDDGFTHPQDPEYSNETTMHHVQYSSDGLFVDLTYIENDEYLTVYFSPAS